MSETVTDIEQLKQEVEGLVGPFFDKYNGLDAEIKKREKKIEDIKQEMRELRDARSYLRTIVRNINPELIPPIHSGKNGSNGKKKKSGGKLGFGAETMQAGIAWIQSRREELNAMNNDQGFRPVDIQEREDWDVLKSSSAVNKLFIDMHEKAGVLALNKWVRGRPYGDVKTGKFYKVV